MTMTTAIEDQADDYRFCESALEEVSRSFAQPIALLPEEQKTALMLGYLLCRVADTIEDSATLLEEQREELFSLFHRVLRGQEEPQKLIAEFGSAQASDGELRLLSGLEAVMRVFFSQRARIQRMTIRWVSEMTDGMRLYCRRAAGREFTSMMTTADLERYCYFVAGTVGHLITDLFDDAINDPQIEAALRKNAESFGLGLQLVNMVKDITDDFERGVSYMPRDLCLEEGFEPEEILALENREQAFRVTERVIDLADAHLQRALQYVITIPVEHQGFRLFCLLPLFMAVETLALARGNSKMFEPGRKVKISREIVGSIIGECGRLCRDDQGLREAFARRQAGESLELS